MVPTSGVFADVQLSELDGAEPGGYGGAAGVCEEGQQSVAH